MNNNSKMVAALLGLLLIAQSVIGADGTSAAADLIFTDGQVYTVDEERTWAKAVAVRDGRIIYVGDNAGALELQGEETQLIALDGKMLLPSFQDVHIHPVSGGIGYIECPLFELEELDAVLAAIAQCTEDNPDAELITGKGWNWGIFPKGVAPEKSMLDKIDSTRPLIFEDSDAHTLWLNSAALAFANITVDTVTPDGGDIGRIGDTNEPNGTLFEGPAMELINDKLPSYTGAQLREALLYAQRYLHSLGITAMQDAYVRLTGNEPYKSLEAYAALRDSGELDLRVVAALYWEPGAGLAQIPSMEEAREQYSQGRLQATSIKFWADGIIETYTARMLEPYSDKPDTLGLLMVPMEELQTAIPILDAKGFQIHIHAIGDGTVRYGLDALEGARKANGARDSRHLTAHTQIVHPDDIARFAELDVIAGFSPYWTYADSYVADINPPQLGPQRMSWMYPMQSILRSGGRIAFGSDWSVSTASPLFGIETALTHIEPDGEPTPVLNPDERIGLDAAIAGYTIEAAYANFLDEDTGSIEVGKFADLVVLDQNLFKLEPSAISDVRVMATYIEGKQVYSAAP